MSTYGQAIRVTDLAQIEDGDGTITDRVQRTIFRQIVDTMDAHRDKLVGDITIMRRQSDFGDEGELDGDDELEMRPFTEWAWRMTMKP